LYVFSGLGLDLDLVSGECFLVAFWVFPSLLSSLLSTGYLGLGGFRAFVCFLFSTALSTWFVHFVWNALGQRGSVGTGFGPAAYGPHWPRLPPPASLAPIGLACPHRPRLPPWRRGGPGSDARQWTPDVILGFAEYALSFPIYIFLSFSLVLLFRQSLLYDSQFNISIGTRLISTKTPGAGVSPHSLISAPHGVVGSAPRMDLAC
jgi:hypothetical protein